MKPFFLLLLLIFATLKLSSQETPSAIMNVKGDWSGTLDVKLMQLTLILHIEQDEMGAIKATLDCLEQGMKGIPVDAIQLNKEEIKFEVDMIAASFEGAFNQQKNEIIGNFVQNGMAFPLILKAGISSQITYKRPQEPSLPYPYKEEEVIFENPTAGVILSGTLTLPQSEGPFPAVLLIAGSGPQDRNETVFGHKPFLVLADYLTRQGIVVLRADKRGIGKSTGKYDEATSEDFASDVLAGIEFLKKRPEVKKIGLIGHSEGGIIAPIVASQSKDISFIVLMAGAGVNGEAILLEQAALIQRAGGVPEKVIEREAIVKQQMFNIVKQEPNTEKAEQALLKIFTTYLNELSEESTKEMTNSVNVEAAIKPLNSKWFRYFLVYDPSKILNHIKVPVLALNGTLDLQVSAKQNLLLIAKALKEAENQDFTIVELPQHNHLFQVCQTGLINEYAKIEETISPLTLNTISKWILDRSKD